MNYTQVDKDLIFEDTKNITANKINPLQKDISCV